VDKISPAYALCSVSTGVMEERWVMIELAELIK